LVKRGYPIDLEFVRELRTLISANESYDFIVVGAGRLAVPAAWPSLQATAADWADITVPQAATGKPLRWPRGRGLGGSSAINAMSFGRGHRGSYDAWVTAGAKGWGFEDLLPFFRRSEHAEGRIRPREAPQVR
jgi:choline dehydrogenase-like flavoprotein